MAADDVAACEGVWRRAWRTMRERYALPLAPHTDEDLQREQRRIRHCLVSDPAGSFVAIADDRVVGFAQALVRDELWVLSLFGVEPQAQGNGIGRALLDAALVCGEGLRGMILSSRDPIAMRRYASAGFELHPALTGYGEVRHERLGPAPDVREGDGRDLPLAGRIARAVRGAAHGNDIALLLDEGARLLLHRDDSGFAVLEERVLLLAATSDAVAAELLVAALHGVPVGATTEIGRVTAPQQWALEVAVQAGLELHPVGPVALRGFGAPPAAYIPSGSFG
jgi:GNAT superfamily N-acetyltransferase